MKKIVSTLLSFTILIVCLQLFTACIGNTEVTEGKEKEEQVEFVPLNIENFSFEIPTYWKEDKKTKDSIRYYAETGGKVAMLTISYGIDDKDPVTWQMLYNERELMVDAIEHSMSSMDCKVSGYKEVVSNYGEKGLLYECTLNISVDNKVISGNGGYYCLPSEEDNRWFFINYVITENVEYHNYDEDFLKLIASSKCNYGSANEEDTENIEITVTMNEEEFKGLTPAEAKIKLKEMGFTKFKHKTLYTNDDANLDGKIGAVEIRNRESGKGDFSKGDTYKSDAVVVLWSYKYTEPEK